MAHQANIPPQAVDVERSLLGAMLTDQEALQVALQLLSETHFYEPAHSQVFKAMQELTAAGKPVDILTVETYLRNNGKQEAAGAGHLADLIVAVEASSHAPYYCQILLDKALKRKLISECTHLIKKAYDESYDPATLLDDFNRSAGDLDQGVRQTHSYTPSQIFQIEKDKPVAEKLFTGLNKLDYGIYEHTMRRGQVELTIADSGHGKTQYALYKASLLAKQGYKVGWFQLEDYRAQTAKYFNQRIPDEKNNIFICDDLYSIEDIKREARRLKREHRIDYLVFDYVQNIESPKKSRADQVEHISQQITRLAKSLNVYCHVLSQITMPYSTRQGWKQEPGYGDVRWSQQLKQDAHIITSVFRPSRIKELITGAGDILTWENKQAPYDSVFIKQCKVRYGKQEWKRLHMIHAQNGLELYHPGTGRVYPLPVDSHHEQPEDDIPF